MKSLRKTLLLFAVVLVLLTVSCKKKPEPTPDPTPGDEFKITYVLNGGQNNTANPTSYKKGETKTILPATKDGSKFVGWFTNAEFTGGAVSQIVATDTGDKTFYAQFVAEGGSGEAKWTLNKIGFDGKGMDIIIKVLPVSNYDPFDANYPGESKTIKQAHQRAVESAYNVKLHYEAWGDDAQWGPQRVKWIRDNYLNKSLKEKGIYVMDIASQWIPTLVKGKAIASLYNTKLKEGAFLEGGTDVEGQEHYEQDEAYNQAFSVKNNVYGYNLGSQRPDNFMYYNATRVSKLGLEDPAELWLKGEWNLAKFDEWVKKAQTSLGDTGFAIDCGYAEFTIGITGSTGNQMIKINNGVGRVAFTNPNVTKNFDLMKDYYNGGYWNKAHGVQDVSQQFLKGQALLASGEIWFLQEETRFNPAELGDTKIGVVPYPASDDDTITPITEPYTSEDSEGNTVNHDKPLQTREGKDITLEDGSKVYGLDLSNANFQVPFSGANCYSFLNIDKGLNDIDVTTLFCIMRDLDGACPEDPSLPELTNDEAYQLGLKKKLSNQIDVDVIMSCQGKSYFELMEVLSMTVGDGSHFGDGGFWVVASGIITKDGTAKSELEAIKPKYEEALTQIGY